MKNRDNNLLIEGCIKKKKSAQLKLYNKYCRAMYNTSYRILRDEYEAEDIMQEAFLTAFTKIESFKGEVSFGAWLKKIVINKSLTQLKKNIKYREVKLEIVPTTETEEETEASFVNTTYQAKEIMQAINSLKENYRLVLTLNFIEGYDYEEIASILNYSNENVRTTISRAKKKLKEILQYNEFKYY
ncbi:RNA polymerase sigma factor [Tenacibaculum sp. SG-28]|uniref:RNA polymerase sigma factor n=1 Tax=Tenacibaculum sp. SG-28 TaxID=754426 RepID=UPI000D4081A3|nr:sigma-70 family RNA polymerase sigma factor [Tenacibaculum sp. SG-28]PQJ23192.1 RNA polymerase subunit sigma [Tenacibaculum sp. SG-28]